MVHALHDGLDRRQHVALEVGTVAVLLEVAHDEGELAHQVLHVVSHESIALVELFELPCLGQRVGGALLREIARSEEHTSELQSLMRISYAVFCLKKKKKK